MGEVEVLSQSEAWAVYDRWIEDGRVLYVEESSALEARFRALTQNEHPAPKDWGDSFLFAFAETADLRLVTFDQALRQKGANVLLLQSMGSTWVAPHWFTLPDAHYLSPEALDF